MEDDTITSHLGMTGVVGDTSPILAGFQNTLIEDFVDISLDIAENGGFTLNRSRLEEINGAVLEDGAHSLTLFAQDAAGNLTQLSVSLTLDTTTPTAIIADSLDTTATFIEVGYSEAPGWKWGIILSLWGRKSFLWRVWNQLIPVYDNSTQVYL